MPAARRASGLRGQRHGLLGHVAVRSRAGGRLVREPKRLPESLPAEDVGAFVADLGTHRDRAMVLAMVLGGLRAAEVRSLRLADVDPGLRRVRVVGKGGKERVVPVDDVFFIECAGDEQGGNLALGERRGVRGEYLDVEAAAVAGFEGQVGDVLTATEVAVAILGARQLQPSTVVREWRDAEQGGAPL